MLRVSWFSAWGSQPHKRARRQSAQTAPPETLNWVTVQELNLSYYIAVTIFITMYTQYRYLVQVR